MTSESTFPANRSLSEPLLPPAAPPALQKQHQQRHDEDDCESQSQSQTSTVAGTSRGTTTGDEADAAAGGMDPTSSSSQRQTRMNGFVLAVILFFNASGMCRR
jgi:hypothetical protein